MSPLMRGSRGLELSGEPDGGVTRAVPCKSIPHDTN